MTHSEENARRIAELNAAFMALDSRGRDSALAILRALGFAQAVMKADPYDAAKSAGHQKTG